MVPFMEVPKTGTADPPPAAMAGATLISRLRAWRAAPGAGSRATRAALAGELDRRILAALPVGAPGITAQELRARLCLPAGTHSDFTGRQIRASIARLPAAEQDTEARPARYWRILR